MEQNPIYSLTSKKTDKQITYKENYDITEEDSDNKYKGLDDIIKIELDDKNNISGFELFVKKDSHIKKEIKIGEYFIGLKKCILYSPVSGKILEIDKENFKVVIERCKHDQTYINLCVYCGYDIR